MTLSEPAVAILDFPSELIQALGDDGESLALLHDRELTAEFIGGLKGLGFPHNLGMLPSHPAAEKIWAMMAAAVEQFPDQLTAAEMDELAVDYAAIYLTGAYGASPCESVWTDDDHLVCQESMFQLREIYEAAGLETVNWRCRPEDHLVLQVLYIVHGLRTASSRAEWSALARMMDEHLLRWLPDFADRVAGRCAQPFYAALALLTAVWCEQLRDLLATVLQEARPTQEEIKARLRPKVAEVVVPLTFVPGVAPSW